MVEGSWSHLSSLVVGWAVDWSRSPSPLELLSSVFCTYSSGSGTRSLPGKEKKTKISLVFIMYYTQIDRLPLFFFTSTSATGCGVVVLLCSQARAQGQWEG